MVNILEIDADLAPDLQYTIVGLFLYFFIESKLVLTDEKFICLEFFIIPCESSELSLTSKIKASLLIRKTASWGEIFLNFWVNDLNSWKIMKPNITKNKRKPLELLSDRKPSTDTTTGVDTNNTNTNNTNTNNTNAAGDLKLRDSVVVTVYARNIGKDLF